MMLKDRDTTILFVCTGNTCRSPMAAGIFNTLAGKAGLNIRAISCGIAAFGNPVTQNAVAAAADYGSDISAHLSCKVDEGTLKSVDRVYTMTALHRDYLISRFPDYTDRISVLAEEDISDPFGGDISEYRRTAKQLKEIIEEMIRSYEGEF